MIEEVSFIEVIFSFALWITIYYISKSAYEKVSNQNSNSYFKYGCWAILYCVFAYYAGDFFNYKFLYYENLISNEAVHLESIYFVLIKNLPNSYLLWRLIVWGAAIILWINTCKRLNISPQYACFAMTIVFLREFPNLRQTLAISILFYGITYFIKPIKNKLLSYSYAILIIYLSIFFHHSTTMYALLFFAAYMAPFNKKVIKLSLALYPFLYASTLFLASNFIEFIFMEDTIASERGVLYLQGENFAHNTLFGWIYIIIIRTPIVYTIAYMLYKIYFKNEETDSTLKPFIKYAYILIYLGFLFMEQPTSSFLSPRFLDASYYPISIAITYYLWKEKKYKSTKYITNLFLLSNIYLFLHSIYTKI